MSLILKIGLVEAKKKCNWCKQPEKKKGTKKIQKKYHQIAHGPPSTKKIKTPNSNF